MSTLQAGTVVAGRYHPWSEGVAQGPGMLYDAHDMQEDRPVDLLMVPVPTAGGSDLLEEVTSVQRAVAGLEQPALVPYEDVGSFGGYLYLVRPHVAGQTLVHLLAKSGPLQAPAAVEIATRLCEALAPAHREGLVHGGLAPDCLFIEEGTTQREEPGPAVTIADLGLYPSLRPALAVPGRPWGRQPYFSPEQSAGKRIQPATDVYVIGCLIYLMLAGRPPFRANDEMVLAAQHLRQEPPSLQILVPGLPEQLVQIVHKALAKEPAMRYRNAGQLAHILRTQFGLQPPGQPVPPAAGRAQPASQGPSPVAPLAQPAPARLEPVAFSDRPAGGDRLVVPPPPRQPPIERAYEFIEDGAWVEEPDGVDWLMLGLFILALAAVLGLIPLWRTVYRRYSVPPATSASIAPLAAEMAVDVLPVDPLPPGTGAPAWQLASAGWQIAPLTRQQDHRLAVWPRAGPELEDPEIFCYNTRLAGPSFDEAKEGAA